MTKAEIVLEKRQAWPSNVLILLVLLLAFAIIIVYLLEPYTLSKITNWSMHDTTIYIKNPSMKWLMVAQWPTALLWGIFAKPKPIWQWLCIVFALLFTPIFIWMIATPPSFMG